MMCEGLYKCSDTIQLINLLTCFLYFSTTSDLGLCDQLHWTICEHFRRNQSKSGLWNASFWPIEWEKTLLVTFKFFWLTIKKFIYTLQISELQKTFTDIRSTWCYTVKTTEHLLIKWNSLLESSSASSCPGQISRAFLHSLYAWQKSCCWRNSLQIFLIHYFVNTRNKKLK